MGNAPLSLTSHQLKSISRLEDDLKTFATDVCATDRQDFCAVGTSPNKKKCQEGQENIWLL
jgi:hypothetical protein